MQVGVMMIFFFVALPEVVTEHAISTPEGIDPDSYKVGTRCPPKIA